MKTLHVDQVADGLDCAVVPAVQKWVYKVVKVTNSTHPEVHTHLSKSDLDFLCDSDDWEVTIT